MDREYNSKLIILAVRNPLDVFVSFFNMVATGTHTKSIRESYHSDTVRPYWSMFFANEVKMWVEWHDFWMNKVREGKTPIFFFRFEDLLVQPEPVLKDMFQFILGEETGVDGSIIEQRI